MAFAIGPIEIMEVGKPFDIPVFVTGEASGLLTFSRGNSHLREFWGHPQALVVIKLVLFERMVLSVLNVFLLGLLILWVF